MKTLITCLRNVLAGGAVALFVTAPVLADDSEIYISQTDIVGALPNVLFIFDTSGSMDTLETSVPIYKPTTDYSSLGSCQTDRVYFSDNGAVPSCSTPNWFPVSSNTCATLNNLDQKQGYTTDDLPAQQQHGGQWEPLVAGDSGNVRCNGVGTRYTFYSGNYLNYWIGGRTPVLMPRTQIVREVALSLANSLDNVKLGLMRYDRNAHGGMILHPIEDIGTSRNSIIATLNTFTNNSGDGNTPLSETFYEAALYLQGRPVDFGNSSSPVRSVDSSRRSDDPNVYQSPIEFKCQKSYVVYLTDGEPTSDNEANAKVATMTGQACQLPDSPVEGNGTGRCTDEIAGYLHTRDLAPSLDGDQTAATYMIGFGSSVQRSVAYLDAVARAGGTTKAYTGTDVPSLLKALQDIFLGIQQKSNTFVTPAISVNAFNRTQVEDDLFIPLFEAADSARWEGNLKKYKLEGPKIVDANGATAVDMNTGFFAEGTTSIWSTSPDGKDVKKGGAVELLPVPAERKIYTYLGDKRLWIDAANRVVTANTAITDTVLTLGPADPTRDQVINAALGYPNGDTNRPQVKTMGDPMHGQPAIVNYGVNPDGSMDSVVYVPTNDGFLHAIDGRTNGGGKELWAFIPPKLLGNLKRLLADRPFAERTAGDAYGLDGDVRTLQFDANRNGIVDGPDDRVWIFFGMRGGGNRYYGLDVTTRNEPKLLWDIGPNELPGIGDTWSPPVAARVKVGSSDNDNQQKFVLIFGGGYDRGQENQAYSTDSVGKRIFMVDAETGKQLWAAGDRDQDVDLLLSRMNNAIPGRITVLDTDGDQFADRMYAGDMGGRIWRFDIFNGNPRDSLVTGGVIATLGTADVSGAPATANRRFYNAPDISYIQRRGQDPYFNIAIGSGYRGHPLDTDTDERFYAIRDHQPFSRLGQSAYDNFRSIVDGDLVDITANPTGTTIPATAAGWKLRFQGLGRSGEKVLAEATTVNGVVLFPTFDPGPPNAQSGQPCSPVNTNRAYAIAVDSGRPALDFNDSGAIDNNDLSTNLNQQGIVGQVTVAVVGKENPQPGDPPGPTSVCIAGVEILGKCPPAGAAVRTFWQRNSGQ